MAKQITPDFGLCIDWETSGATWGGDSTKEWQGIAFGAVVFNTKTFEPVEKLYREVKFDAKKYGWSMDAQRIHGITQEHLEANGIDAADAAADLAEMILKYFGTEKVMFLGHNPEFDRRFTNQLLMNLNIEFSIEKSPNEVDGWIPIHHVMLDTSAAGFITMGLYKSDLLFDAMGLEERKEHNALTDALYTLETCARIKMLVKVGLES
jgi:DNA polymerase III epsilon subunit-like protein